MLVCLGIIHKKGLPFEKFSSKTGDNYANYSDKFCEIEIEAGFYPVS